MRIKPVAFHQSLYPNKREVNSSKEVAVSDDRPRLFVDMDGTLAEWRNIVVNIECEEDLSVKLEALDKVLYLEHYFRNLQPYQNVVDAVSDLIEEGRVNVFVLSCVKKDKGEVSPLKDKNDWLDEHLPLLDKSHRIFVPDGENKTAYISGGIKETDYLLDDYSKNLRDWEERSPLKGHGIKLLNDINESKGTWSGSSLSYVESPSVLKSSLEGIVMNNLVVKHSSPKKNVDPVYHDDFINNYGKD